MPFTVTRKPYQPSTLSLIPMEGATAVPPARKRAAARAETKAALPETKPPKRETVKAGRAAGKKTTTKGKRK